MKPIRSALRLALLAATLQAAHADVIYTAGTYTSGTYDVISQVYGIINLEGATLNARATGSILGPGQQHAWAIELNDGQLNNYGATIAGGVYSNSWAYGITVAGGTANLYSGTVRGGQGNWADAVSMNGGTLNVFGGTVKGGQGGWADGLDVNSGTVNLYGGTVSGGSGVLTGSAIEINGGTVNLYGGSLQAGSAHVGYGAAYGIYLNQGTVNIYGSGFNYDLGPLSTLQGTLTGTLSDGTPLDLTFSQAISGRIVLSPEPSACALLALGLLTIFANLAWRSKRPA